jgi:hypothetical protein
VVLHLYLEVFLQQVERVQLTQHQLVVLAEMKILVAQARVELGVMAAQALVQKVSHKIQAQVSHQIFQVLPSNTVEVETEMLEAQVLLRETVQEAKM